MNDEPREFSAGPLHVLFAGGDLRYMTVLRDELVRRIYVAVRDEQWNTIEPTVSNVKAEQLYKAPLGAALDSPGLARRGRPRTPRPDPPPEFRKGEFAGFRIEYDAEHRRGDIDFAWHGSVTAAHELQGATSRVELRFEMDGVARSTFRTNRTGLCVHHPTPSSEDVVPVALVKHADGNRTRAKLPFFISPRAPFTDIQAITHWPWPGTVVSCTVEFEGDVFEMEDQRNWADASYKTYSRPLSQPFPYTLKKGQKVRQAVAMEVVVRNYRPARGHRRVLPPPDRAAGVNVMSADVGRARGMGPLPKIGVARGASAGGLAEAVRDRLRDLNLGHLRVDFSETESPTDASPAALEAVADAKAVGVPLEVALHLRPADAKGARPALAKRVAPMLKEAGVARFIVYEIGKAVPSPGAVAAVKSEVAPLFPKVPVGPGTPGSFVDLNRNRPAEGAVGLLAWPLNPQMHATDDLTIFENLSAHCDTVTSARAFAPGAETAVGPVTLHRRPDPFAAGVDPKSPQAKRVAPDPRQRSDVGAAWTLGSLKYLAEAGATSVTYYQATGPFGLMEGTELFPLYHVLADVGEFAGGEVVATETTEPRWLAVLTLRKEQRLRILLANLFWRPQPVRIARIKGYTPEIGSKPLLEDVLPPYGVARFDFLSDDNR